MMIELPAIAPADTDADGFLDQLAPSAMVGQADEIFGGGVAGWKQNPSVLGLGLAAFVQEVKPLADATAKVSGADFLRRLRGFGIDPAGIEIAPMAVRLDVALEDQGGADGE